MPPGGDRGGDVLLCKKKHAGVGEVREPRQMREDNARLKCLVADPTLDEPIFQGVIRKRAKAEVAAGIHDRYQVRVPSPTNRPQRSETRQVSTV